ncbi:hypothetical protein [Streptomyces sp. NPDC008150]|uniref:hypothetical protein n=1 Tax=Streptomyces sp. NPDC008150 TaxID=3364816 RepID=UPI0036E35FC8
MTWWFRARRAGTLLPLGLVVLGVGLYAAGGGTVLLPSFGGGMATVVLSVFVPVPLLGLLMLSLESGLPAAEATAVRSVARLDVMLVGAVLVAAVLVSGLVAAVTRSDAALVAGRDTVFLTGLMLLGRVRMGRTAVLLPVGWLMAFVLTGSRAGRPRSWNIVALPPESVLAAAAAVLMCGAGLAVQSRSPRRRPA